MDFAFVGKPGAQGLLLLLSATHGVEGFCGSGCQVALLDDDEFLRGCRACGRGNSHASCAESLWLFALATRERRQRRPQSQFRRFPRAAAGEQGLCGHSSAAAPGQLAPARPQRGHARRVDRGEWRQGLSGCGQRGAVPVCGRHVLWRQRAGVEQPRAARCPARARGAGASSWGGSISTPAWVRAGMARKSTRVSTMPPISLAPRRGGATDVTSFFEGTSTSAPLTGINGAAAKDECPAAAFAGIALEYGTYSLDQVLQAFRAEHWLHNHPEAPARLAAGHQAALARHVLCR